MILTFENISKSFGDRQVLKNAALTIENKDRIGLVGVNGCGKSTLLGIITGSIEYDSQPEPLIPHLAVTRGMNIGLLKQNSGLDRTSTVIEEMTSVFAPLLEIHDRMHELEEEMSRPEIHGDKALYEKISKEYDSLTARFVAGDGYLINVKIRTVLNGMGFSPDRDDSVISTLSGGEKTRLALAKLLLEAPDLLILDEPTNHLDFDTVMWLEDYLTDYKGALLIVSHDRYFLDKLTDSICEIEHGILKRYKGNYSAFTVQKKADTERQLKEYEAQQEEIAKLRDFVDRNLVRASTSAMAKSRIKKLESMDIIENPVSAERKAKIKFEYDIEPPLDILTVKNLDIIAGRGDDAKLLAKDLSFGIRRGDRLGIVGGNGTGKSTLLKMLLGKQPVSKGRTEWNKNIKIAFFDQENSQLDFEKTAMDEIHSRRRTMTEREVRSLLALVRITGENVFKKVGVLSGGERAALSFAVMMLERGNVLVLDEPTNHLDISAKESIEEALCEFGGTVIFVSHDRYLLNRLAGRILEIDEEHTSLYECGFEEFMEKKRARMHEQRLAEESEKRELRKQKAEEKNAVAYRSKEQRAKAAGSRRRIKEIEAEMEKLDARIEIVSAEMSSSEVCSDYKLMHEKCEEYEALKKLSSDLSDEWLLLSEELE